VIHLFVATVEALMQPRIASHLAKLDEVIDRLKKHMQAGSWAKST
jgi:pyruvate-ferredoxin/flavodoxin oxidoreductase